MGLEIALDRVPLREPEMEDFEIMVSESQERMLAVVDPARVEVMSVCERWETGAAAIGEVTDDGLAPGHPRRQVVAEVPVSALVDECPLYDLEPEQPDGWLYGNRATLDGGVEPDEHPGRAAGLPQHRLEAVGIRAVRLDRRVADRAPAGVGGRGGAAGSRRRGAAIAVAIDGNGRRVACDPYLGTIEAVLECAQNLACVGAEPLGLTNCLNFGNPERPHVAWQLDRSVQGLADACEALGVPVVGGNVSLYNETEAGPIYPTPVVGMVGELPDPGRAAGIALRRGRVARAGRALRALARRLGARQAARRPRRRAPGASIERCARRSSWSATPSAPGWSPRLTT